MFKTSCSAIPAATVACLLALSPAMAQEGAYVGAGIGLHQPRDSDVIYGPASSETSFDKGFVGLGSVGWMWEDGIRTEFELGYRDSSLDSIGGVDADGSQDIFSTMANLIFEPNFGAKFSVYAGAGIGISWTDWSGVTTPAIAVYDGNESKFAYQGILGMAIPVADNVDLTLDYRYHNQNGLDYSAIAGGTTAMDHDNRNHNFLIGFRWRFGQEPEPMMEPAPPPPPPPAPAPAPVSNLPENFIIFFDWDKSSLTTQARAILSDAADFASDENPTVIRLTGHADRSGSTGYNMGLSERRARAAMAELVRLGIPENEIAISWKGESENLVATADGVREPQNRRVEIIIE